MMNIQLSPTTAPPALRSRLKLAVLRALQDLAVAEWHATRLDVAAGIASNADLLENEARLAELASLEVALLGGAPDDGSDSDPNLNRVLH